MIIYLDGLGKYEMSEDGRKLTVLEEKFKNLGVNEKMFISCLHQIFQEESFQLDKRKNQISILTRVWETYYNSGEDVFKLGYNSITLSGVYSLHYTFKEKPILRSIDSITLVVISEHMSERQEKALEYVNSGKLKSKILGKFGVKWNSFICSEYSMELVRSLFTELKEEFDLY